MSEKNTVIVYVSAHHGNTKKIVDAVATEYDIDTADVKEIPHFDLSGYDCIGIASGIAFGKYYPEILQYLQERLPREKEVFFIHTAGLPAQKQCAAAIEIADSKGCRCLGVFCCKGFDTYGAFQLIGGTNKNHPDENDLDAVKKFYGSRIVHVEGRENSD